MPQMDSVRAGRACRIYRESTRARLRDRPRVRTRVALLIMRVAKMLLSTSVPVDVGEREIRPCARPDSEGQDRADARFDGAPVNPFRQRDVLIDEADGADEDALAVGL